MVLLALWLARAYIAAEFARNYFRTHGVAASVEIGALGLSGVSGRFALGPAEAPDFSAERIELRFDPLRWIPFVTEVRLIHPVVRARVTADGKVTLGSLQAWLDSLSQQQGKSHFVSDDLVVSLRGLRLLLATPAGALDIGGDVELRKNLPVSLALRAQPARIQYRDEIVSLKAASLAYDQKIGTLAAEFSGNAPFAQVELHDLAVKMNATGFHWAAADKRLSVTAPSATLHAAAAMVKAGQALTALRLDVMARDFSLTTAGNDFDAQAELSVSARAGFDTVLTALQSADPPLADAIRRNLKQVTLIFAGHAERKDGAVRFALGQPLLVSGAKGASLRVPSLTLSGGPSSLNADLEASLSGAGLPATRLSLHKLLWSGGGFTTEGVFSTRFNFAMLHGVRPCGTWDILLAEWTICLHAFGLREGGIGCFPSRHQRPGAECAGRYLRPVPSTAADRRGHGLDAHWPGARRFRRSAAGDGASGQCRGRPQF